MARRKKPKHGNAGHGLLPGFDGPAKKRRPPAQPVRTSIAAAEAIKEMGPTLRAKVFNFIACSDDGATREEIAIGLGLKIQTVCARCGELLEMYLIYDCGKTRVGSSGRKAVVLKAREGR